MQKQLALLCVVSVFLLAACGAAKPTVQHEATPAKIAATKPATPPDLAPAAVAVTEAVVSIAGMAFQPHSLIVATGANVTWQNDDTAAHTVSSIEGWLDSGQLAAGDSFSH